MVDLKWLWRSGWTSESFSFDKKTDKLLGIYIIGPRCVSDMIVAAVALSLAHQQKTQEHAMLTSTLSEVVRESCNGSGPNGQFIVK